MFKVLMRQAQTMDRDFIKNVLLNEASGVTLWCKFIFKSKREFFSLRYILSGSGNKVLAYSWYWNKQNGSIMKKTLAK